MLDNVLPAADATRAREHTACNCMLVVLYLFDRAVVHRHCIDADSALRDLPASNILSLIAVAPLTIH
jgi:hypothetical protein